MRICTEQPPQAGFPMRMQVAGSVDAGIQHRPPVAAGILVIGRIQRLVHIPDEMRE